MEKNVKNQITFEQKTAELDNKLIAYVEVVLHVGQYDYRLMFDKNTKKRFNCYLKTMGFVIGEVSENAPEKNLTINFADLEV